MGKAIAIEGFLLLITEVLGATVGSLGAVLDAVLVAVRDMLTSYRRRYLSRNIECKVAGVLGTRGADNERENEVVLLVCCRCALAPNKLSWAYAGATFDSKKLMPFVACNLGPLVFSRLPLGSDRP